MMTTNFNRESAKIYEFPIKRRMSLGGQGAETKPAVDLAAARTPKIVFGSGWYHEAAIQEAEDARKR